MEYVIIAGLYVYMTLKTSLKLKYSDKIKALSSSKLNFVEIFGLSLGIAFVFYYLYFRISNFESFIFGSEFVWITFSICLLALGVGLGIKFVVEVLNQIVLDIDNVKLRNNKLVYYIFSDIWIHTSLQFIMFLFCIMEISKPIESQSSFVFRVIFYILSLVFGLLYGLSNNLKEQSIQKRFSQMTFFLTSLCLFFVSYESNLSLINDIPITFSYILLSISAILIMFLPKKKEKTNTVTVKSKIFELTKPTAEERQTLQNKNIKDTIQTDILSLKQLKN